MKRVAFFFLLTILVFCTASTCDDKLSPDCFDTSLVNPSAICAMVYTPVCGCDGKTYSNACVATAAGILQSTLGECD